MIDLGVDQTLETMLKEYPSKLRFLKRAEYIGPNCLQCKLYVNPNWAYDDGEGRNSPVGHFTANEASISHNQMAYVLVAYMAQNGALKGITPSLEDMNNRKFNQMFLTETFMKFKKEFVSSQEFSAEFYIEKQRYIKSNSGSTLFVQNKVIYEGGKAFGTSMGIIQFDSK